MSHLPVIVGLGGINAAGRSSFHNSYKLVVADKLSKEDRENTYTGLASMMGLIRYENGGFVDNQGNSIAPDMIEERFGQHIAENTRLRKINDEHYDPDKKPFQQRASLSNQGDAITFTLKTRNLPSTLPDNWQVNAIDDVNSEVRVQDGLDVLFPDGQASKVSTGGQLPTGMKLNKLYQSRNHPRGLQMTVYGCSDALRSVGIDWETIQQHVRPDQVSVYASSAMGQMDENGGGGYMSAAMRGKRATSKQLPLSLADMPADFINAYILGSTGNTGASLGACASFHYNLVNGVRDIQSGRARVAIVGSAEAPVTPEIIEGYGAMGALATDDEIAELDQSTSGPDRARACRPFGYNCGFTMSESAQFFVLMDDELALELGAKIYGAVPDVFVNADGFKKSISSPGVGNYLTLWKAAALGEKLLGRKALQERSFIHAHGTGTPQNRVTESHVFNEVAKSYDINNWLVSAIKCYVGHSLGTAGGDQLNFTLGTWQHGLVPGITTLDEVAEDVHQSNLRFEQEHTEVGQEGMDMAFLNSKGFGGNNATALVLAPHVVKKMLAKKHGKEALQQYEERSTTVEEKAKQYEIEATRGTAKPIYHFDNNVLVGDDLEITDETITVPGQANKVTFTDTGHFDDICLSDGEL